MSENEKYNGYNNYETWLVALENGGMVADLVNSTLSDVDWYELAEMYIKEVTEE